MAGSRRSRPSGRGGGDDGGRTKLKIGFVLLVGVSGGLTALQGDASPPVLGLATLGGLLAGGLLVWYLSWIAG
ncbi:hypothetical protein OB955_09995 [Halobacteria archaeon AArc-m2/3/4]|uniref:Uncharacterized protein n=1 Tax=Natronoglomus mannanivorans TaxID=2979990 RepID=A0AAP2YV14_9EURY|nr:hypothetical protein [Halobacteria archaeon AArc-xg1-1]MCU4973073.1 hypothetical protein [Halobacteria archaeon AArc-m2/3/4]